MNESPQRPRIMLQTRSRRRDLVEVGLRRRYHVFIRTPQVSQAISAQPITVAQAQRHLAPRKIGGGGSD